ncbi:MAG: Uma2 family endonuclease [Candidatus Viridilinea halotolerans]|uniref:Uma2 family endonuclease n=1 Tax=Candidatus Viridilinea halotolerans TaxID=2491704 RepID=A0A426TUN1_9CHLR|nr:MAG: Uma2 family endonuclease [Candidatus Viridilinea halotolerans]
MLTSVAPAKLKLTWTDSGEELDGEAFQGLWSDAFYLHLSNQSTRLIEFSDGVLEVLPMPTNRHQSMLALLYELFVALVRPLGGKVLFSALRMRIRPGKFREPDLLLLLDKHDARKQEAYWLGADLVLEVVSPDDPERDTVVKRGDYAEGGIPEYWIVNPLDESITVLTLDGSAYREHGRFLRGTTATSLLLPELRVAVDAVFDAE